VLLSGSESWIVVIALVLAGVCEYKLLFNNDNKQTRRTMGSLNIDFFIYYGVDLFTSSLIHKIGQ
jgi:hypothetical protein